MPSLKDLAKECGVSVATVSKALNNQPDIAPATRERIRAAARRMGYLPNAAARALKTNRTYNLGVLFVDEKQSGLTHEYFSAVLDSFKVEAEKRGYDITFINHNISGKSMSYLEHCHYRGVDGVVIACVNFLRSAGGGAGQRRCAGGDHRPCVQQPDGDPFRQRGGHKGSWCSRHGPADTGASPLSMAKRPPLPRTVWQASIRPARSWG